MADKDPALGWCEHHQVYHRNFVCEFGGGVDTDPPINYVRATERAERDALKAALDEAERTFNEIAALEGSVETDCVFASTILSKIIPGALACIRALREKVDG